LLEKYNTIDLSHTYTYRACSFIVQRETLKIREMILWANFKGG